jgi:NTE family protein
MGPKTALVLSAGGMFGAYQAGAWRELSIRFQPDMVIGTSVGALNGWAIAGGCPPEELIRFWADPSAGAFLRLRSPLHRWRGLFDGVSFSKLVQELFSAFRPQVPFGVVLTDALRLRPRLIQPDEVTWQHLAAACAIPLGLPPVRIGGRWYVDGGVSGALPLWPAAQMGAARAITINALPLLTSRFIRAGARAVRWISPQIPSAGALEVIPITPSGALGSLSESVRWNRDTVLRWIERGAEDAQRVVAAAGLGRDSAERVLQ